MAAKQITVAGQILHGVDRFGKWTVNDMEGWWDAPDVKSEEVERIQVDGDFDLPVQYKARYPLISGSLRAPNRDVLFEALNMFTGLLASPGRLVVEGYGETQWADVRRASGFSTSIRAGGTYFKWQMRLKAPNPRKFGELHTFAGDVGAGVPTYHRGNYAAHPVATVTGTIAGGYRLQWGSGMVSVTTPLVPGSPHVIDFRTGRLTIGGVFIPRGIALARTWTVAPGITQTAYVNPIAGGSGTVQWSVTDTYI